MVTDGPYVFYEPACLKVISLEKGKTEISFIDDVTEAELICHTDDTQPDEFTIRIRNQLFSDDSFHPLAEKILVTSDIEGNFYALKSILMANRVIDEHFNWEFGKGHLVLLGDMIDRGKNVTACLWLIYKLENEALQAGGKVHFILGNHEEMNFNGDERYVHDKYLNLSRQLGIENKDFYSEKSVTGRWMRSKNIIEKMGDILFCHAGISPAILKLKMSIDEINILARNNYQGPRNEEKAQMIFSNAGILWYRGLFTGNSHYPQITQNEVDDICSFYGVSHIVVGHTMAREKDFSVRFKNKVIGIDIKHPASAQQGSAAALLIEGRQFYKVSSGDNRKVLL